MIEAIVLAAGESHRMGQPKALLPFHGQTLLGRCLATLRASPLGGIVVVLGDHAEEIAQQVDLKGTKVAINPRYKEGRSTSIRAGIVALASDAEAALFVPADQPFVTPELIGTILRARRDMRAPIVVPTAEGARGTPVLIGRELFAEAELLRGDAGYRALFPRHATAIIEVPVSPAWLLLDLDTPEQYERALRIAQPRV